MFLVCGEALMDVFARGNTPGGMDLDARIGGSPLNVAIGLARPGQRVEFLGALSSGFLGENRADDSVAVQARPAPVVDSVGAGDTFSGGASRMAGRSRPAQPAGLAWPGAVRIKAMLEFVAKAAAMTCTKRGTDMPRHFDLV